MIGSDISIRAIDTATKNAEFAGLENYSDLIKVEERQIINDPMIFGVHWPS